MDGLYRAIIVAKRALTFQGIIFGHLINLTHLLFVDEVLIFCQCATVDCLVMKSILTHFSEATCITINVNKFSIYLPYEKEEFINFFTNMFKFTIKDLSEGIKYLVFNLKQNKYGIMDWSWLISKHEQEVNYWCNRWICRGGRLVLLKIVLEAILVYWHLFTLIPKGSVQGIKKIFFNYMWKESMEYKGSHMEN